jgi:hypothetical protein
MTEGALSWDAPGLTSASGPLVQVRVVDGRAAAEAVPALEPREIPLVGTFAEPWPVGRDQVIGEVAAELAATLSVQLYGAPGVGKKAIARAVIRRLAAGPNPVRGVELWPAGQDTLDGVLERLAGRFFGGTTFRPSQGRLRVAAAGLAAVVVIGDCELSAGDLAQLLATFPDCTFLLTSEHRTMFSSGVAHEVGALSVDAAAELIARQAGSPAAGLARLPVADVHRLADGRTQRLLQHAAFLRLTRDQSGPVGPPEQAAALARGLSGPAADVLAALATFGTELTPDCFAAVTGWPALPALPAVPAVPAVPALRAVPALPETGAGGTEAGAELEAAALVTRVAAAGGGFAYRIAPDALAAVRLLAWPPSSAVTAGRGLLQRLTWPGPSQPPPSPALLLAVAGRLHAGGHGDQAARLIRVALPEVLGAGYVDGWQRLLRLGLETAEAAGLAADLAYFAAEDDTRRRLCGEKPAAGTGAVVTGAGAVDQLTAGLPGAARPAAPAGPAPQRRSGAHLLLVGYGIPLILVVVVLALAGALAARSLAVPDSAGPRASGPEAAGSGAVSGAAERGAAALGASQAAAPSHARPAPGHPRPAPKHFTASPSPRPPTTSPAAVVQAYFAAINAREYRKAWQLGGDHLTPSYSQFVAGFADTVSDTVDVGPAPGEVVAVLLTAVQADGTTQYYTGTYTVRGGVITGSDIRQTG